MNTNSHDVIPGSNLGMSSGSEVESAAFRSPVEELTVTMPRRSGIRAKVDDVKSKVHDVQNTLAMRGSMMKSDIRRSVTTAKSTAARRASESMSKVQTSMATSPMKWAGIAAGSGFAIGLLGRLLQTRRHVHPMPQLVVIETSC